MFHLIYPGIKICHLCLPAEPCGSSTGLAALTHLPSEPAKSFFTGDLLFAYL